jgi:leucyl aminopeptidase (aminopeptidase T)
VLVTVAGFGFGIYQYRAQQIENRKSQEMLAQQERDDREAQLQKDRDTAQRDFMKPLLEKQLSLYFEASSAASTIATTIDSSEREKATNTFWRLYYGPLVIVENKEVSNAMQSFAKCLSREDSCSRAEMSNRSLILASKLQEAMLKSWNLKPENFTHDKFTYN